MTRPIAIAFCLATLAFAGCSQSDSSRAPAETPSAATAKDAPPAPSGNELNQAIQQPLDRAKAVEGDLMKAQQADDEKLREQGG